MTLAASVTVTVAQTRTLSAAFANEFFGEVFTREEFKATLNC
jgi:hypothetical protein